MLTAVLIDGSNIYATAKALGKTINYRLLRDHLRKQFNIFRIYYFTAIKMGEEDNPVVKLADWLEFNGFKTVLKDTKEFTDPVTGLRKTKGNMDMEMAVAAYSLVGHVKHIVLFTGDGDFSCLVEDLQSKGIYVTVVSTISVRPVMIAGELRRVCDEFIDLGEMEGNFLSPFRERTHFEETPRFGSKPMR